MAHAVTSINEMLTGLAGIVDRSRILTDPEVLDRYGGDTSLSPARRPDVVVSVLTTAEVQQIVKFANENLIPVTPRSSRIGFHGAGIPEQGGIVIDLSGMKKVRRVDTRNRWALFEAGVTYGELQASLAPHGMRALNPLLPHWDKSVITSTLEREPRLTSRHHLDETILTMEMVLPTGELFHTGSMAISPAAPETIPDEVHSDLCNSMGPGIDWYRLIPGSLGTYGIVTVMNTKIAFLPARQKVLFFGFKQLEDCVEPLYRILRKIVGDECLLLNSRSLAAILAPDSAEIERLSAVLPAYTIILNLTAGEWFPEQKMAYQEHAIHEIARTFLLKPMESLPHVPDAAQSIAAMLYRPGQNGTYWKFKARGACQEIFFLTQLQHAPARWRTMHEVANRHGYPAAEIGLYLQPKQHGRAFHMELSLPYNPASAAERDRVQAVFMDASAALLDQGAFFYRVYGPWADMVYSRTGTLHPTLKRIKRVLDPNGILNPGKLGF